MIERIISKNTFELDGLISLPLFMFGNTIIYFSFLVNATTTFLNYLSVNIIKA